MRNMFMQSLTELYPQWDDDVEDTKVDNLIQDLVHDRYCPSFYREIKVKKLRKSISPAQNSSCKKKKMRIEGVEEEDATKGNDKVPTRAEEQIPIVSLKYFLLVFAFL